MLVLACAVFIFWQGAQLACPEAPGAAPHTCIWAKRFQRMAYLSPVMGFSQPRPRRRHVHVSTSSHAQPFPPGCTVCWAAHASTTAPHAAFHPGFLIVLPGCPCHMGGPTVAALCHTHWMPHPSRIPNLSLASREAQHPIQPRITAPLPTVLIASSGGIMHGNTPHNHLNFHPSICASPCCHSVHPYTLTHPPTHPPTHMCCYDMLLARIHGLVLMAYVQHYRRCHNMCSVRIKHVRLEPHQLLTCRVGSDCPCVCMGLCSPWACSRDALYFLPLPHQITWAWALSQMRLPWTPPWVVACDGCCSDSSYHARRAPTTSMLRAGATNPVPMLFRPLST